MRRLAGSWTRRSWRRQPSGFPEAQTSHAPNSSRSIEAQRSNGRPISSRPALRHSFKPRR